jgi:hypothetical protein
MEKHDFIKIAPDPTYHCTVGFAKKYWRSSLSCDELAVVIACLDDDRYCGFCEKHRQRFEIEAVAEEICFAKRNVRTSVQQFFRELFLGPGSP